MQPSYSLTTNPPSFQGIENDNKLWEGSAFPPLVKIESDHVGTIEPILFDFSKRHSEREVIGTPI